MQNGTRPVFDVTQLIEPIPMKAGAYEFKLPPDMSMTAITDIQRQMGVLSKALDEEGVDVSVAEDKLWTMFEGLMSRADPPPPTPVRELFTTSAMTSIIAFLLNEWGEAKNSMTFSQSPTSSTAPLRSANS